MNLTDTIRYQQKRVAWRKEQGALIEDDPELAILQWLRFTLEAYKEVSDGKSMRPGEFIGEIRSLIELKGEKPVKPLNYTFMDFYKTYDKLVTKNEAASRWQRLTDIEREAIMNHLPKFLLANPEKKYRPAPARYLKEKRWMDELDVEERKVEKNKKWLDGNE